MNTITHPVLGLVTDIDGHMKEWGTATVRIDTFNYETAIHAFTDRGLPTESQLAAMVDVLHSTLEFKKAVEGYMFEAYRDWIRPAYIGEIGDTRYRRVLLESDLPEIQRSEDIWKVITGMNTTLILENCDLSLSFDTTFDPSHEFVVRFQGGKIYEVMMDG